MISTHSTIQIHQITENSNVSSYFAWYFIIEVCWNQIRFFQVSRVIENSTKCFLPKRNLGVLTNKWRNKYIELVLNEITYFWFSLYHKLGRMKIVSIQRSWARVPVPWGTSTQWLSPIQSNVYGIAHLKKKI